MAAPNFAKTVKEAAVIYARSEFDVFPAYVNKEGGKQPFVKGWKELHVSHDPVKVEKTFESYKKATIVGWLLPEDIIVIDIDVGHTQDQDGFADFQRLDGRHPDDIKTPQARSPRGGRHLFFRKDPNDTTVYRNWIGIFDCAIDVKKLWIPLPTTGLDGRTWIKMPSGSEDFAPIPDWVKQVPQDQPTAGQSKPFTGSTPWSEEKLAYLCAKVEHAPDGSRDKTLWGVAKVVGGYIAGGVFEENAWKALLDAAMKMNPPLMSEIELAAKIKRGVAEGSKQPLNAPPAFIDMPWREQTKGGAPKPSLYNARLAIETIGITCSYDTFHEELLFSSDGNITEVSDNSILTLRQRLSDRFGFDLLTVNVRDAVESMALEHSFDPVVDMLNEAEKNWDGVDRHSTMAAVYINAEDTLLNNTCLSKWMIAAVARARDPGCKFDNILVLESIEGWNKSKFFLAVAGSSKNFSDTSIIGKGDRDVQEQLAAVWIHENAELGGMKKTDIEHVKAFASRQIDRARPAYGHYLKKQPRHSVEGGTTNKDIYLLSTTGNRRFWCIKILASINVEKFMQDRLQLLGEAAARYRKGESLVLDESLWADAAVAQEDRRVVDPWEEILKRIPEMYIHRVKDEEQVKSSDLLTSVLRIPEERQHQGLSMRLSDVMKLLGWEKPKKLFLDGWQYRGYSRKAQDEPRREQKGNDYDDEIPF